MLHALVVAILLPSAAEGLESRLAEPYELQVSIRLADDPLFTRLFGAALGRQVRDQLAGYFKGDDAPPLARVEVLSEHPLAQRLDAGPLEELALTPADFAELGRRKLFLVLVDYDEGLYRIRWRQIDGDTQQLGPPRTATTPDRAWVGKAICRAVVDDFAPVAAVELVDPLPGADAQQVKLSFRGAATSSGASDPKRLERWIGIGSVFQPLRVVRQPDGSLVREPVPDTILRVGANDTLGTATVHSNRKDPLKGSARVVGFEAIKLTTQPGRLRLRLLYRDSGNPALGCEVYASTVGFGSIGNEHRLPRPDRHGYVVSREPLDGLAFVRITQGTVNFQFPVPITGPWCEIVRSVPQDKSAKEKADFQRELRYLVQDLRALQASLDDKVRELNDLHSNKRYEEALKATRELMAWAAGHRESANNALQVLDDKAAELKLSDDSGMMRWCEEQIKLAGNRKDELKKLAESLEKAIEKIDAQNRANVLVELGDLAYNNADFQKAIDKYQEALAQQPDQPKLKDRLKDLEETWEIKNPQHKSARELVDGRWAEAEVNRLDVLLPEAQRAFETLKQVGDHLTARKLARVNSDHVAALSDLVSILQEGQSEEDQQELAKYAELTKKMADFQQAIAEFVESAISGMPPSAGGNAAPENAGSNSGTSGGQPGGGSSPAPSATPAEEEEELPPRNQDQAESGGGAEE